MQHHVFNTRTDAVAYLEAAFTAATDERLIGALLLEQTDDVVVLTHLEPEHYPTVVETLTLGQTSRLSVYLGVDGVNAPVAFEQINTVTLGPDEIDVIRRINPLYPGPFIDVNQVDDPERLLHYPMLFGTFGIRTWLLATTDKARVQFHPVGAPSGHGFPDDAAVFAVSRSRYKQRLVFDLLDM